MPTKTIELATQQLLITIVGSVSIEDKSTIEAAHLSGLQ